MFHGQEGYLYHLVPQVRYSVGNKQRIKKREGNHQLDMMCEKNREKQVDVIFATRHTHDNRTSALRFRVRGNKSKNKTKLHFCCFFSSTWKKRRDNSIMEIMDTEAEAVVNEKLILSLLAVRQQRHFQNENTVFENHKSLLLRNAFQTFF